MSVTIAAVPAAASGGADLAPASAPAPTERALMDYIATLQNSPASGAAQLANPATLASELFGSLRGYLERARNVEKAVRSLQSPAGAGEARAGEGVQVALMSVPENPRTPDMHGGPARESLEPADASTGTSPGLSTSLDDVQRVMDLALASVRSATETALLTHGAAQISRSVNSLLRGQ
jgi:hypothetical protein